MTSKQPRSISDHALREAFHNLNRPLRRLPAAWWEDGVAERMSGWIKKLRGEQ